MLNAILTGHGSFSTGLASALEMIAGEQENFIVLPFQENDSLTSYATSLHDATTALKGDGNTVVIFTDLAGGTPFNQSMLLQTSTDAVYVIAGTNLPMLLTFTSLRENYESIESALENFISAAQGGTLLGELREATSAPQEDGNGI